MGFRETLKGIRETMKSVLGNPSGYDDEKIEDEAKLINEQGAAERDNLEKRVKVNSRSSIMKATKGRVNREQKESEGREPGE